MKAKSQKKKTQKSQPTNKKTKPKKDKTHDFFTSACLWKDRKIDAEKLRKEAWKISR